MSAGRLRVLVLAALLGLLAFGGQMLATGTAPARVTGTRGSHASIQRRGSARRHARARRACHRHRHRCRAARRRGRHTAAVRAPTSTTLGTSPLPTSTPLGPAEGGSASAGPGSGQPVGGGAPTSVETPSTPAGPARVQVLAKEYSLTLSRTEVPAGKVTVEFVNGGEDPHNLHLEEPTAGIEAGAFPTSTPKTHLDLTMELKPGSYTLFCSLPEHEAKGMKATLTVH